MSSDTIATNPITGGNDTTSTNILIEILSCWNLPKGDLRTSDPYVKIKMGNEDLHETKHMLKTLDPVFTIKHDSMYCLKVPTANLQNAGGLTFKVKDWDKVGSNDTLGQVQVPFTQIMEASGERLEFPLEHPKKKSKSAGHIAICCRPATAEDTQLLQQVESPPKDEKKKLFGGKLFQKDKSGGGGGGLFTKNKKNDKATGETLYRIRPTCDPQNPTQTEWLSAPQIIDENQKPSQKWLDVGSGTMAKVFVEIMACSNLPDKDKGLSKKNKTDAFCSLLYEDSFLKTDVIDDCLSPKWMPWMKRAFIFRMQHPSSHLHLCVLDSDTGPLAKHDVIGKISINVGQFVPHTLYNLEYPLYESSKVKSDEEELDEGLDSNARGSSHGTVQVRLRVEYSQDARSTLLGTPSLLVPTPSITVNVDNKADHRMVRKALQGKHDTRKYSIDTLKSHVQELKSYAELQFYVTDALLNLFFWKGNQFPIASAGISVPVHSLTMWIMGIWVVENPSYLPSAMWWSITWFMLATQLYRTRSRPNPWWSHNCHSFGDFILMLTLGKNPSSKTITENENEKTIVQFQKEWSERLEEAQKLAEERAAEALKEQEEYEALMAEMDIQDPAQVEDDSSPQAQIKSGGFSLLKPVLYPLQQNLAMVCDYLRIARNIVVWEESYYAFWITLGSFVVGLVLMVTPWIFLMRWTCRFVVYILLGPWMYAVDKYYIQPMQQKSAEEQEKQEEEELQTKIEAAQEQEKDARQKREEALKQKDMKAMLYGNYETPMPILQTDRYYDIPLLATSSAVPHTTTKEKDSPNTKSRGTTTSGEVVIERIGGQTLPSSFTKSTSTTEGDKKKDE